MNVQISARKAVSIYFFLSGCLFANWASRIPAVEGKLHLSPSVLGSCLLCMAIGALLSMPVTGALVARSGSRPVAGASAVMVGLSLILLGQAPTSLTLAAALFVYGVATGLMNVSMNAQAVGVDLRSAKPVNSSFHALFSLGGMTGSLMGSAAASLSIAYPVQLATVGVIGGITAVLIRSSLLPPDSDRLGGSTKLVWISRPLASLGMIAAAVFVGEGAMADWTGIYLKGTLHTAPAIAAFGYGAFSATMCIGRFTGDWLTHHFSSRFLVRTGCLLATAGVVLGVAVPIPWVSIAGFGLVGIGLSVCVPLVFSAAGRATATPGVGLAAVTTAGYLGFMSGPPIIGYLADLFTLRIALLFIAVLTAVGAVLASSLGTSERHASLTRESVSV